MESRTSTDFYQCIIVRLHKFIKSVCFYLIFINWQVLYVLLPNCIVCGGRRSDQRNISVLCRSVVAGKLHVFTQALIYVFYSRSGFYGLTFL